MSIVTICIILCCIIVCVGIIYVVVSYILSYYTLINKIQHATSSLTFTENTSSIDAVITYVDCCDPEWRQLKSQYLDGSYVRVDNPDRWNDQKQDDNVEEIEICLLSILTFMPYIRIIHIVTQAPQIPKCCFQNPIIQKAFQSSKIQIVHHKDFIPRKVLPTFNSDMIEIYLRRIPQLAEKFVYFNDDTFVHSVVPVSFLFQNQLPVAYGHLFPYIKIPPICHPKKAFSCNIIQTFNTLSHKWAFYPSHHFKCFTKQILRNTEIQYHDELASTFTNKFRAPNQMCFLVLATNYGLQTDQILLGDHKYFKGQYVENPTHPVRIQQDLQAFCLNNCNGNRHCQDVLVRLKQRLLNHQDPTLRPTTP